MMRAVVFDQYGDPVRVMKLASDREVPKPKPGEVLVKNQNASINAADRHMVRGDYLIVRLLLGLFRPAKKNRVLGMDIAGTVHAVGQGVRGFEVGDSVVADIRKSLGGGFAEYTIVDSESLVKKPGSVSFEQAATVPISGQAAMMGVILCGIKPGDRVLIRGASGGVGSFAVQIAKSRGAHVTAMCSPEKSNVVKSWGADEIVDSSSASVRELPESWFDSIFDAASFGSPSEFARVMKRDGKYVLVGGDFYNKLRVKILGRWYAQGAQEFIALTQEVEVTENIRQVLEMINEGEVTPFVQKVVPLSEVPDAISRLEQRVVIGKTVVNNQL